MLYLWPNEYTRRSLIYEKWLQSKGPSYGDFSDEAIAELKELGIPVVYSGNSLMINPPPDMVLRRLAAEDAEEYRLIWRDFLSHGESSAPASDTVFSEGIGEEIDFLPARSEEVPVTSESQVFGPLEHVDQEDKHVHPHPTIQPPAPPPVEGIEASGWEGLSSEQRDQAKQLFDEYGTEEGLRRLREMDPEAARRFESDKSRPEQDRRGSPSRDVPDGGQSESKN